MTALSSPRILAIDPTSRGFGFVILEADKQLLDWGAVSLVGQNRNTRCLTYITRLLVRYHPDLLVTEDMQAAGCRRRKRVRELAADLASLCASQYIPMRSISRLALPAALGLNKPINKHRIAMFVAEQLSVLAPLLPPPRKTWMTENPKMGLFIAAAYALAIRSNK